MDSLDRRIVGELERLGRKMFQIYQIPETKFAVQVFADYLIENREWLSEEMTKIQSIDYFHRAAQHVKFAVDNTPAPWKV